MTQSTIPVRGVLEGDMSESASGLKFLVIGATGNIGSLVTPALLERGEIVRCMVRNPGKAQGLRDAGAEVVIGDLDKKETLAPAMEGIDTVFLVISINKNMKQQGLDAIDAALEAGVSRLIRYTAVKTTYDDEMPVAKMQEAIDTKLKASGLKYSHVRPHNYMQGLLAAVPTIQSDSAIYMPWGEGKVATTDLRDIAEAAVEVLTGEGHDGKSYSISGPEAITLHQAAAAISDAIGKKVSYIDIPPESAKEALLAMGIDSWVVDQYLKYFEAFKFNHASVVYDDLSKLTGRSARTIADFARDYAHVFNSELAKTTAGS